MIRLHLASASPRRRDLLQRAGIPFTLVEPRHGEEVLPAGLPPAAQAEEVALQKALSVTVADGWVLGADTIVALGDRVFEKPRDRADAARMLGTLAGTTHTVITGVALVGPGGRRIVFSESTRVTIEPMTPDEVRRYHEVVDPLDKSGAIAIEETAGGLLRARVEGSVATVMGLPVERLGDVLRSL